MSAAQRTEVGQAKIKLVLLGESAVGKTALALRFAEGQFCETQKPTIGASFLTKTVSSNDKKVKFEIWDTAGQENILSTRLSLIYPLLVLSDVFILSHSFLCLLCF